MLIFCILFSWFSLATAKLLQSVPLLQLQRKRRTLHSQPLFDSPHLWKNQPGSFQLNGFCKQPDSDEPACTEQPCCCWSTYGADAHIAYPSPDETESHQKCLNPPQGFEYSFEPGLSFDNGYLDAAQRWNQATYAGRRLCCLTRDAAGKYESQRTLADAVPPMPTTSTAVNHQDSLMNAKQKQRWTTVTTSTAPSLEPGDEYGIGVAEGDDWNHEMEAAARAHMAAANELTSAVAELNVSAEALNDINTELQDNPSLAHRRERLARMKGAVRGWAERRWSGLKALRAAQGSANDPMLDNLQPGNVFYRPRKPSALHAVAKSSSASASRVSPVSEPHLTYL